MRAWERQRVEALSKAVADLLAAENNAQEYMARAALQDAVAALYGEAERRVLAARAARVTLEQAE